MKLPLDDAVCQGSLFLHKQKQNIYLKKETRVHGSLRFVDVGESGCFMSQGVLMSVLLLPVSFLFRYTVLAVVAACFQHTLYIFFNYMTRAYPIICIMIPYDALRLYAVLVKITIKIELN